MIGTTTAQYAGTILFALAILHSFCVQKIHHLSLRTSNSILKKIFVYLGEIELVFAIWAIPLFLWMGISEGPSALLSYLQGLHFAEALFVFVILLVTGTRPILIVAQRLIHFLGTFLRKTFFLSRVQADLLALLTLGPLAGSLITEPAAMTVSALLLSRMIQKEESTLLYPLLGVLFVNVSIGGALTPFAAPPLLMVARTWGWNFQSVFFDFGFKVILAVFLNSIFLLWLGRKKIKHDLVPLNINEKFPVMRWRFKESFLVAIFLGGLICFGPFQVWWLAPLLQKLDNWTLYFGATALTAVVDNAALTYLGSQVQGLSEASKYFLVAGAIAGGGLTIIANAPNAAGFQILQGKFKDGLEPLQLFLAGLIPTLIAVICLSL